MTTITSSQHPSPHSLLHQTWHMLNKGMAVQNKRSLFAAQNFVNANSVGQTPGAMPYTRKQLIIHAQKDRTTGMMPPHLTAIQNDPAPPVMRYQPSHPAADARGFVKYPKINPALEMADFQNANMVLNACAQLFKTTTSMMERTHNLMRNV